MGPLAQFLLALTNLVRSGIIRNIPTALKAAEREFGKVTPLLKKQIERVFEQAKKQIPGKPGEKGRVIPFKKTEGIETLDEFNLTKDDPMGDLEKIVKGEGDTGLPKKPSDTDLTRLGIENLKNPKRPGGPLDPVVGITRTIARRILDKKGIKIDRREDPLDIFLNNFGIGAGTDIQNLGEEISEAESTGRDLKPLDDLIELEGFFDLEVQKNPDKGMSDQEFLEKLEEIQKDVDQKNILEDFDPEDREPNAEGGLTRTKFAIGSDDEPLKPDPTKPINPFGPKPTGPVLPDKSMMASSFGSYKDFIESTGDEELMDLYLEGLNSGDFTKLFEALRRKGYQGRDDIATGGLAGIINL